MTRSQSALISARITQGFDLPIRVDPQLRHLVAIHANVNVARIQGIHNISGELIWRIGPATIDNDIEVENHQTGNTLIFLASKLSFRVLDMRPYPAPHFATKNLDAFFLNRLRHFFVRWVGLKLFALDHNSNPTNHNFVVWKLAIRQLVRKVALQRSHEGYNTLGTGFPISSQP